jgi:WD40 repeat protein
MELWDVTEEKPKRVWSDRYIRKALFIGNGSRILSSSSDFFLPRSKLWDVAKNDSIREWENEEFDYFTLSHDESRFLSLDESLIKLWDFNKEDPLRVFKYNGGLRHLAFTAQDSRILSISDDGSIDLWDAFKGGPIHTWKSGFTEIPEQAASTRHDSQVVAFYGNQVKVFDASLHYESLSVAERFTELEVRSASRLDSAGQLVPLKVDEWLKLYRSPEYQAIQEKMKAADKKSALK